MDSRIIELTRFFIMLSDAMELASPGMAMHQLKTSYMALAIAERLDYQRPRKRDLLYASLLHDIGALSPEEKVELHSPDPELIARHSASGRTVLARVPLLERSASIIGCHHEPWNSAADHRSAESFDGNIIHLADSVEISLDWDQYILFQHEAVRREVRALRGTEFAPEIADAFLEVSEPEEFWLALASPRLPADFAEDERLVTYHCSIPEFAPISKLVRDIIDFRSTFTATHSSGVAASASVLGSLFGFSEDDRLALEIAGNLHDIGKMAVPNSILLKPAALDERETAIVRQHPYHTGTVLSRGGLPREIVEWASWHHERLDGSGYPRRSSARTISLGSRILAVTDVFTALAEERPYRPAMRREPVQRLLDEEVSDGMLEASVVGLVQDKYDLVVEAMRSAQESAADFYRTRLALSLP
jgi:HD-GYP domain-containing protein (c-di-GMP phosphodiesterase class II)